MADRSRSRSPHLDTAKVEDTAPSKEDKADNGSENDGWGSGWVDGWKPDKNDETGWQEGKWTGNYEEEDEDMDVNPKICANSRLFVRESAGIRFFVDESATEVMSGPAWVDKVLCSLESGPMRCRIVGNIEDMGLSEGGSWDPQFGTDLLWQPKNAACDRSGWHSTVQQVLPGSEIKFCVLRVDQPDTHPGCLQGYRRVQVHESRRFRWSDTHTIIAPQIGEIMDIFLSKEHCLKTTDAKPETRVRPRPASVPCSGGLLPSLPPLGRQSIHNFDAPDDVMLKYSLYLPPGYKSHKVGESCTADDSVPENGWPLAVFFHSMHASVDSDNNMFHESDTPLRLLLGFDECPRALKDKFVLLTPQCPPDYDRPQGTGIWLRKGWYETSTYKPEIEVALMDLIESVTKSLHIDRNRIVLIGSSMGCYCALELCARHPKTFTAAALIAQYYDLDPIDELVRRMTESQKVPLWFFHAKEDGMCPHDATQDLVDKLREKGTAEVRFTSYNDTWSRQGHCADPVAFFRKIKEGDVWQGEELFEWFLSLRLAK